MPNIAGDNTLSFLGLLAGPQDPQIVLVRLITGTEALGPNDGGAVDMVAMDDFLFREPQLIGVLSLSRGSAPRPCWTGPSCSSAAAPRSGASASAA